MKCVDFTLRGVGRRKRLPPTLDVTYWNSTWGMRFRLPTVNTLGVFITFGGPQAHGHSLAVAVRKQCLCVLQSLPRCSDTNGIRWRKSS